MPAYTLGTLEASEALLRDLYIDLRAKVNAWSQITCQTPRPAWAMWASTW